MTERTRENLRNRIGIAVDLVCTLKPGKDCCLFHRDLRINLINIKNKLIIFVAVTVLKMLLYVGVLVFWDKRN